MADLRELISAYHRAREAFENAWDDDEDATGQKWGAKEAAEHAVVVYPCKSLDDVRTKARFFLENDSAYDAIRNCRTATEETLLPFLRSLLGEERQ